MNRNLYKICFALVAVFFAVGASANTIRREKELKELYREKILVNKSSSGISDYRICKIFSINHGNLHSFLYQGKSENISLAKTRQIYEYVSNSK